MVVRMKNSKVQVDEAQVEDALVTYPELLADILVIQANLSLLLRQYSLPSGRLDLVAAFQSRLLLIELKVVPFHPLFLAQVCGYRDDLVDLQHGGQLVQGEIVPYLVCTSFTPEQETTCRAAGVIPITYSPEEILRAFFSRLRSIAQFVHIKPTDHGLWNIHLIHRTLAALAEVQNLDGVSRIAALSRKSVVNHVAFASQLGLVIQENHHWRLTPLGIAYVSQMEETGASTYLSEGQRRLLREFIVKDPFSTSVVFGIYTIVDCVFTLARNTYPVEISKLQPYYRAACGKESEWIAEKTMRHGVRMYSNYAIDLGLLGRAGNRLFLTPDGIRSILVLQLHKGIAMVDAIRQ